MAFSFTVSDQAIDAIKSYTGDKDLFPFITWSVEGELSEGEWIVGFIDSERLNQAPPEFLYERNEITFVVDGPGQFYSILDNAQLDYTAGKFIFS